MLGSKTITFGPRSDPGAAAAAPPYASATIASARATAGYLAMRISSLRVNELTADSARTSYDPGRLHEEISMREGCQNSDSGLNLGFDTLHAVQGFLEALFRTRTGDPLLTMP